MRTAARGVARPRERVDLLAMPACDLRDDVCGGAEPVDADLRIACKPPRAIADQTGTQQRRRMVSSIAGGSSKQ